MHVEIGHHVGDRDVIVSGVVTSWPARDVRRYPTNPPDEGEVEILHVVDLNGEVVPSEDWEDLESEFGNELMAEAVATRIFEHGPFRL